MSVAANFKRITTDNWLDMDPVLSHFVRVNRRTGESSPMDGIDWVTSFLEPQVAPEVPTAVTELIEGARGAMMYGWFFYPLYVIGEDQLYIAAEAALRAKYVAVEGVALPHQRLPRFNKLRTWAVKKGAIPAADQHWWAATERLRNSTTHTPMQRLTMPGEALRGLRSTCTHVNALFEGD